MQGKEMSKLDMLGTLRGVDYTIESMIEPAARLRQGDDEADIENMTAEEVVKYEDMLHELAYWSDAVAHHAKYLHNILDSYRREWLEEEEEIDRYRADMARNQ